MSETSVRSSSDVVEVAHNNTGPERKVAFPSTSFASLRALIRLFPGRAFLSLGIAVTLVVFLLLSMHFIWQAAFQSTPVTKGSERRAAVAE